MKKPLLAAGLNKKRLDFASKHMSWDQEWQIVVFSDEKKYNLDDPDGLPYH